MKQKIKKNVAGEMLTFFQASLVFKRTRGRSATRVEGVGC
jgi:hypothetical protein